MFSIDSFENYDSQKKPVDSTDDVSKFDDFASLMAAFLFAPAEAKLTPIATKPEQTSASDVQFPEISCGQPETAEFPQTFGIQSDRKADTPLNSFPLPQAFSPLPAAEKTEYQAASKFEGPVFETKGIETNGIESEATEIKGNRIENPIIELPPVMKPPVDSRGASDFTSKTQPKDFMPAEMGEVVSFSPEKPQIRWQPTQIQTTESIPKNTSVISFSQVFQGISKDLRAEKSFDQSKMKQTDAAAEVAITAIASDDSTSPIKVVQPSQLNTTAESFPQPEGKITKPELNLAEKEDFQVQGIDNFSPAVGSETSIDETAASEIKSERVLKQIEAHLEREGFVFTGKTEKVNILKLRLRPAELGTVEIKLEKSASGKLTAHFQTESEATRQILVERFDDLQNSLQKAGWQIDKLDISCNSFVSAGNENRDGQSRQAEPSENRFAKSEDFEKVSEKTDDSISNRLVNLRA